MAVFRPRSLHLEVVHDDLLAGGMQMIERMEEFFLCPLLADDKLDIIDHKDINRSVFFPHIVHF